MSVTIHDHKQDATATQFHTDTNCWCVPTISGNVTINGKAMWTVEGVMTNGDVSIYRYVDTKNSRRLISRRISPLKLKKWGN
jgi:hypothetical protein